MDRGKLCFISCEWSVIEYSYCIISQIIFQTTRNKILMYICCCNGSLCNKPNPFLKNLVPRNRNCYQGQSKWNDKGLSTADIDNDVCVVPKQTPIKNIQALYLFLMSSVCVRHNYTVVQTNTTNRSITEYGCGHEAMFCLFHTLPDDRGCQKVRETEFRKMLLIRFLLSRNITESW